MGCANCSSNAGGVPAGCKSNGSCGSSGCEKLEVYDWLSGMELPNGQRRFDIAEVRFKGSRKSFYRFGKDLELHIGDVVVVEATSGYDVGVVSLSGELVKLQMDRKKVRDNSEIEKVLRIASQADISKWQEARKLEDNTMYRSRVISKELGLDMKLSDVEYQGDQSKATFYYTANDRVDFRELIRKLADEFKVRIEMRQIGARQEASRVGGIGSCGRELCCSSWMADFRSVSTSAARYQQLSLNPQKLAGQCGKLKCCLNYELDQYLEAVNDFPPITTKLFTEKGNAFHFKTDIFKRIMYYVYEDQAGSSPVALSVDAVKEIIKMNKLRKKPFDLKEYAQEEEVVVVEADYENVVGQDALTRFDKKPKSKKRRSGGRQRPNKQNTTKRPPKKQ